LVFYPGDDKVGSNTIKQIATKMCELNVLTAIVVLKGTTSIARKELESLNSCKIEIFTQSELEVNITEHELVPKHEVLSNEMKQEVLKKYRVKEYQLPKIQVEDPIARYFGVKKG
jgi:DNA-directed RNA polymerase I, II, and III subunit RPABC1